METKTEAASFAATNLEPEPAPCVHCGQPRAAHGLRTAACLKAGYYNNRYEPVAVIPVNIEWEYGTRWQTAEGHTDEWWSSEEFAREFTSTARGDASLVRRMVITGPAEVVR